MKEEMVSFTLGMPLMMRAGFAQVDGTFHLAQIGRN